ncbi:hypothetical protein HZH66_011313 [Vespula vulgaris]|uniref:Uncharacterized protein n=1 Tax=Vespula vulgaris TaxID=7454 RepID=A0A834JFP8_VESVU|nr:hypothetical protein HZH66_011313 [Vespula vulgaris]
MRLVRSPTVNKRWEHFIKLSTTSFNKKQVYTSSQSTGVSQRVLENEWAKTRSRIFRRTLDNARNLKWSGGSRIVFYGDTSSNCSSINSSSNSSSSSSSNKRNSRRVWNDHDDDDEEEEEEEEEKEKEEVEKEEKEEKEEKNRDSLWFGRKYKREEIRTGGPIVNLNALSERNTLSFETQGEDSYSVRRDFSAERGPEAMNKPPSYYR